MKAVTLGGVTNKVKLEPAYPVPKPEAGQVLVKVAYAAQNPPDVFTLDPEVAKLYYTPEHVMGSDFSGVVVESLSDRVPVGARVCGWIAGNVSRNGTYAEYLVADADLVLKVPDTVPFDAASVMGMSFMTAVQALALSLGLDLTPLPATSTSTDGTAAIPAPDPAKPAVLVWGGSTACGHFAIQLLKQSGHRVATTASARSRARVEALGADLVVGREDVAGGIAAIREAFPELRLALDCFAQGDSAVSCAAAMQGRGHVHTLYPVDADTGAVKKTFTLVHATLGRWLSVLKMVAPPIAEAELTDADLKTHRALMARWYSFDQGLGYAMLKEKRIVPMEIERWTGGLEGIQSAIDAMREGKWSGAKIVHTVAGDNA
jgi:NADPH:quinone reductase-like Zn-dependent oxidoreductase